MISLVDAHGNGGVRWDIYITRLRKDSNDYKELKEQEGEITNGLDDIINN